LAGFREWARRGVAVVVAVFPQLNGGRRAKWLMTFGRMTARSQRSVDLEKAFRLRNDV
jgi:hypothetical protein